MEMHQIRYFLAVARVLNFTRAAEECNVAQPSLTRAIKLLEEELGGELFRRERNLSHLTELGQRMLPLMQQCYDSALSAKSLAGAMKSGSIAPLALGLSRTVCMDLLIHHLTELMRAFKGLELKFLRGSGSESAESLKKGDSELLIAGPLGETWERLDAWPLFTEGFELVVGGQHPLAGQNAVELERLKGERILKRPYCEQADQMQALLRSRGVADQGHHQIANENDTLTLVGAGVGIAIVPKSAALPAGVRRVPISDLEISRTVHVYAVAGRPRSPAAAALLKLLRAADWSRYPG